MTKEEAKLTTILINQVRKYLKLLKKRLDFDPKCNCFEP